MKWYKKTGLEWHDITEIILIYLESDGLDYTKTIYKGKIEQPIFDYAQGQRAYKMLKRALENQ